MKETELAAKVVQYLRDNHYVVYQEVKNTGKGRGRDKRADIVAVAGDRQWIIETKTSLGISVIHQAHLWVHSGIGHYVSCAVPITDTNITTVEIFRALGLGLILVSKHGVDSRISAPLHRNAFSLTLNDAQRLSVAGNNTSDFWSPYKQTCNALNNYVANHNGCILADAIRGITHHYKNDALARNSLYVWLKTGSIKGVVMRKEGRFLRLYKEVNA